MHWVPHATACIQRTYVVCSSKWIQWCCGMYLLTHEIKRLVVEWTGTSVEFGHSYNDFDRFNSYGGRLELWLSLHSALQTRHILQTIRATRKNGQYIWVSATSTQWLDQSLLILQASLLPIFPLLRNIALKDMEKQLPWRNNKSTIKRFEGRSLRLLFILSTRFSTLESLCFVWIVRCGNVILSCVYGRLTTSKTFTCTQLRSPLHCVRSTQIIVCRREFIVVAMERLSAIHPIDSTCDSGWWFRETGCKTISGRSSSWNLRRCLLEYEMHLCNDYFCTRYSSYHLSRYA